MFAVGRFIARYALDSGRCTVRKQKRSRLPVAYVLSSDEWNDNEPIESYNWVQIVLVRSLNLPRISIDSFGNVEISPTFFVTNPFLNRVFFPRHMLNLMPLNSSSVVNSIPVGGNPILILYKRSRTQHAEDHWKVTRPLTQCGTFA